jgi:hypothetical protein
MKLRARKERPYDPAADFYYVKASIETAANASERMAAKMREAAASDEMSEADLREFLGEMAAHLERDSSFSRVDAPVIFDRMGDALFSAD